MQYMYMYDVLHLENMRMWLSRYVMFWHFKQRWQRSSLHVGQWNRLTQGCLQHAQATKSSVLGNSHMPKWCNMTLLLKKTTSTKLQVHCNMSIPVESQRIILYIKGGNDSSGIFTTKHKGLNSKVIGKMGLIEGGVPTSWGGKGSQG